MPNGLPNISLSHALLSAAEMSAADKAAESLGISGFKLMESAGAAVARLVRERWTPRPLVVLCGPGNNGGDGFVAARHLAEAGWEVRLGLFGRLDELHGDAAAHARLWRGPVLPLTVGALDGHPLVIDALFGAGLSRGLSGAAREAIARINAEKLECVAVDVPSGVSGDTGLVLANAGGDSIAPACAATATFFHPKPAHLLFPWRALCGHVSVFDIGIPATVLDAIGSTTFRNAPGLWSLPSPAWSDHKYARGHAVVVGGASMTGAARLAGRAARRAGAGLLTFAVPASALQIYAADSPGAFVHAADTFAELDGILSDARRNGVLIGPGGGAGAETAGHVLRILGSERPVVLDADALTSFQGDPTPLFQAIRRRAAPVIMTPHGGEFRRLFKSFPEKAGKLALARLAAAASGAIVVLKGADTVVAGPDGRAAIADNAPPWLATGGSGDVLAGFVLGLLVQAMPAWEAACAAVWMHGEAAALAGRGLIAEDLPEMLPKVLKSL